MLSLGLQEISKRFSTAEILHSISFSVAPGQRVALTGESGSGKTTLLRIISGLESPTSGRVRIGDLDVTTTPANKRGVGVVFQDYATYPRLSVAENLGVSLVGGGINRAEKDARMSEVSQWLGLSGMLKRLPSELSGGQLQRVALGKAIMARPKLLLLDEPFSQLDVRLAEHMRHWLADCHARFGMTQIMVTHDPLDALTSVDMLAVLHQGRLSQFASPDEVRQHPRTLFAAQLTSPCGVNVLPAHVVTSSQMVSEQTVQSPQQTSAMNSDTRSSVGIRPEAIRLSNPGTAMTGLVGDESRNLVVEARMLGVRDLGIVRLAQLGLGHLRLSMLWPAGACTVNVGDKVVCTIKRDDLMMFSE